MRILFQGDSITDAGRNREDYHDLGQGYPKYAAEYIKNAYPDIDFEFIDLGISGDQTKNLVARLDTDFIDIQPDIVSILIGINDVWHHSGWFGGGEAAYMPHEVFEERYRTVLSAIKEKTNAKIMIMEPFLIPAEDKIRFRVDLDPKIQIIRKLAREFADVYLPTDGLLASAYTCDDPFSFAADGVHPTPKGADFIGKLYCDYVSQLIENAK